MATNHASDDPNTTPSQSRLLPQFSFRGLAWTIAISAVVAFTLRNAYLGAGWARALLYPLGVGIASAIAFAILFLIAWLPANLIRSVSRQQPLPLDRSDDELPPQIIPPPNRPV
jgi:hypothetical protein